MDWGDWGLRGYAKEVGDDTSLDGWLGSTRSESASASMESRSDLLRRSSSVLREMVEVAMAKIE
jgi:hypothetical protein